MCWVPDIAPLLKGVVSPAGLTGNLRNSKVVDAPTALDGLALQPRSTPSAQRERVVNLLAVYLVNGSVRVDARPLTYPFARHNGFPTVPPWAQTHRSKVSTMKRFNPPFVPNVGGGSLNSVFS